MSRLLMSTFFLCLDVFGEMIRVDDSTSQKLGDFLGYAVNMTD